MVFVSVAGCPAPFSLAIDLGLRILTGMVAGELMDVSLFGVDEFTRKKCWTNGPGNRQLCEEIREQLQEMDLKVAPARHSAKMTRFVEEVRALHPSHRAPVFPES
jgi:hypothetical protein